MRRAGRIASNNNRASVRHLAYQSVKSSGIRNIFVIITIALSVSLVMVMALFYFGTWTAEKRQTENMQHIIYYQTDEEQLAQLAEDERTEYVLPMKTGKRVEIDGITVEPVNYAEQPLKDQGVGIDTIDLVKGRIPEAENEIVLADAYCKAAGIEEKLGETVEFTFLDGKTEQFVISGICHMEENMPMYLLVMSDAYARNGSQLKDIPYDAVVRISGIDQMNQTQFEDLCYSMGAEYGIERKNMNINNYVLGVLPGEEMRTQEMMLIAGVGIGIMLVSILVIYSVFYLSVVGRIRQFGQLQTVGMTRKQIRSMVRQEGFILSGIGIPAGLIVGTVIGYLIRPAGFSIYNTLLSAAGVTVLDLITVQLSVYKPAKKAALVSPIEAAKYSGYGEDKSTKRATRHLKRKITPVRLARISSSRSRKRVMLTMISLGVGGILYMAATTFSVSFNLEGYARQGAMSKGEFILTYESNLVDSAEEGKSEVQRKYPIPEELTAQLNAIDGVKQVLEIKETELYWESNGDYDEDTASPVTREQTEKMKQMSVEGSVDYEELLSEHGVIMITNESQEELYGWRYKPGDSVKLSWYDGNDRKEDTFRISGIVDVNDYAAEFGAVNGSYQIPGELMEELMPGMNLTNELVIHVEDDAYGQVEEQLNEVLTEYSFLKMITLEDEMETARSSYVSMSGVFIGLSLFVICFSILNLLNTLITNILTRKREFAMLQSVGMTERQLKYMIRAEGIILAAGNLVFTLVLGTAAGYWIVRTVRDLGMTYMHYQFPVWYFTGYVVFIIAIPILITEVMIRRLDAEPLVERLREVH